jgi:hypothetical protein
MISESSAVLNLRFQLVAEVGIDEETRIAC